ncbi:hypothetical protein DFP97_10211 [Paenibacillus prosopidis]|uniref:PhzF family phenazine biosynthesis protein n=1 Tax=Paenibacillus prosopidis TaxID=630520 RepID=A0A368W7I9_9BACL|nr:hypothetical protein DFP97_10211 [Paenibacillus prosopidis]
MENIQVFHYDGFSTIPNRGNPAGVVLQADRWKSSCESDETKPEQNGYLYKRYCRVCR